MPAVLDQVKNYEVDNLIISKNVDSTLSQNKTHFATLRYSKFLTLFKLKKQQIFVNLKKIIN